MLEIKKDRHISLCERIQTRRYRGSGHDTSKYEALAF
jgi:hypothetical protein